jgi:hypothetical protein
MSRNATALGLLAAVLGCAAIGLADRADRLRDRVTGLEEKLARRNRPPRTSDPSVPPLLPSAAPSPAPSGKARETQDEDPRGPNPAAGPAADTARRKPGELRREQVRIGDPEPSRPSPLHFRFPSDAQGTVVWSSNVHPLKDAESPEALTSLLELTPLQRQYIEDLQKRRDEERRQAEERYEQLLRQGLDSAQRARYEELQQPTNRLTFLATSRLGDGVTITTARYALITAEATALPTAGGSGPR